MRKKKKRRFEKILKLWDRNMSLNKKKNIILLIATAFLFLALIGGWPYGFFTLLRFVVFAISAYIAWMAYEAQKEKWVWIFGFLAVLFNPFIVIHLNREIWSIIDLIVGIFMLISVFILKLNENPIKHDQKR